MLDLRPIHNQVSTLWFLCQHIIRKGISSALEQIWVTLDRKGHWLSTREANWLCLGGRSRSKGAQTKHSSVLSLFTCFHHTLLPPCLICASTSPEQVLSAGWVLTDAFALNTALRGP